MKESKPHPLPKALLRAAAVHRHEERYERLKEQLLALGWIAQGSVLPQPPHAWRLTRKVKAKTVSLALSAEQAALYRQAIANQRRLEEVLRQMRALSEKVLQGSAVGVKKRPRPKHPKPALS